LPGSWQPEVYHADSSGMERNQVLRADKGRRPMV